MDKAIAYAESVVGGHYPQPKGRTEIACCQRFLNDLERQGTPEFPYVFDEKKAHHIIEFSETLTLAEGEEPQPFHPADFQGFTFENWNGWVIKDTNNRRFRTSYMQIGRQNGKSVMNSVPALYYGNFAGYRYPQIYCVATKSEQAKIVLRECYKFIKADRELEGTKTHPGLFTIKDYVNTVMCNLTGGYIMALGRDTDTIDGFRPFFGSIDEYHKHPTNQMYKLLTDGDKKMKSCLVSIITTAGFKLLSPCKKEYDYAIAILHGFHDEAHYVYIAEPDEEDTIGDAIYNENMWPKAHPLWTPETLISLRGDAKQARQKGGEDLLDFQTKDLNLWVSAVENRYINGASWDKCLKRSHQYNDGRGITLEDMRGRSCGLGLDLSAGGDLTAGALEFKLPDSRYLIHGHAFMPAARLEEHEQSDKAPYREWARNGQLDLTETLGGFKTDYKYILAYYRELLGQYDLTLDYIAYDPHNASAFLHDLEELGAAFGCDKLVCINQSARNLNDPTDDFRNTVDAGDVLICVDCVDLVTFCFLNASLDHNSFKEIKIDKAHRTERIDVADAVIDTHSLAMSAEPPAPSIEKMIEDGSLDKWWELN